MAVLIEGISVVVCRSVVAEKFVGGVERYQELIEAMPHCADSELIAVRFMTPPDVEEFVKHLEANGLAYLEDDVCVDVAVVDQQCGCLRSCEWISFGSFPIFAGHGFNIAWHSINMDGTLGFPKGWSYSSSLSKAFAFAPVPDEAHGMLFLRQEANRDVYLNQLNGKEVYVERIHTQRRQGATSDIETVGAAENEHRKMTDDELEEMERELLASYARLLDAIMVKH